MNPGNDSMAEKSRSKIVFGPASREEIGGIIGLMRLRPPTHWMSKVSPAGLTVFMDYAVGNPHAVILTARPQDDGAPVGYVFAIVDSMRFWGGFSMRHLRLAHSVTFHRLKRLRELRRRDKARARADTAAAHLPSFSWSPSRSGSARIIGLYVRKEYHKKGIAMDLYFTLFDALKEKGCERVEEYAAPDYVEFAGKFPKVCGWELQPCVCGGYKITRSL